MRTIFGNTASTSAIKCPRKVPVCGEVCTSVYLCLQESDKTVTKVLVVVEAASQMAVTMVLFVRSDGEHRGATAAEMTGLFENTNLAH